MSTEKDTGHIHHAVDYVEINVTDMSAAKAFYASAFGWSFTDYGPGYSGIAASPESLVSKEQGGLALVDEVTRGGSLIILYSADIEQSERNVTAAGGGITKAIFPFPGGRRFQFTDPAGNELAVWTHP